MSIEATNQRLLSPFRGSTVKKTMIEHACVRFCNGYVRVRDRHLPSALSVFV